MPYHSATIISCLTAIACIISIPAAVSAAGAIQASLGDTVLISGYSYTSQTVYLFLTGPNLPVNGVALHDITKRADQGAFTRVEVDGNDHWVYRWRTASPGGRLDEGAYTIWVVNGPNDRSRLNEADYRTISVVLGTPSLTLDPPGRPGAIALRSVPEGASVVNGEKYWGKTPLTREDLAPATYEILFALPGYQNFSTRVPVEAGKVSEVVATLIPDTGSLAITTVPAGARVLIDGGNEGISPLVRENLPAGNHLIVVAAGGYTTAEQTVTVIAGRTRQITIVLVPASPATTETVRAAGPASALLITGFIAIPVIRRLFHTNA